MAIHSFGAKTPSLVVALAAALASVQGASAQDPQPEAGERAWQVALWMKGGYQWSSGTMANNAASDAPDLRLLETVSELEPGAAYGGGVELRLPRREFTVRVGWETINNAAVTGRVAVCALFSGPLCEPRRIPADIWSLSAVVRLVSGNPERTIRPVISAGVGLRGFAFTLPQCPPQSAGDPHLVCQAIVDLYEDPRPHSLLLVGGGVQAALSRLIFELGVKGTTGSYVGGSDRTDGNWYQVLRLELSTSARVF